MVGRCSGGIYPRDVFWHVALMFQTVTMPLWAFLLVLVFAVVTFASHFLFPSVRWFFRKRAERLVARLNTRLRRPIEPFKLARRYDMIQRLMYDPEVSKAIFAHAREHDVPENVAFETAHNYAREIVPSFSAMAYFTFGTRLAKWLSRFLYRVRLEAMDAAALERLDPDATVVFVINHRSNMDYVLVTHLISRSSALSYAVGEWARIWPLSAMIRMMGAYFIRRRARTALYRVVLARYVQMATSGGVTQAFFPEGGLSLDGVVGEPKLGLLNYIIADDSSRSRDVVFVPVALNYDQVIEDRFLIRAGAQGNRKFRPSVFSVLKSLSKYARYRLSGQFRGLGTASVVFGPPLRLSTIPDSPERTATIARSLMARIRGVVPVLAVPLVAYALTKQHVVSRAALTETVAALVASAVARGITVPQRDPEQMVEDTLQRLSLRGVVRIDGEQIDVIGDGADVLRYYANTIAHHFEVEDS